MLFNHIKVWVRGGGDLASGAIMRLHKAGFRIVISELATPMFVRRAVCYGSAIYQNEVTIDGITAMRIERIDQPLPNGVIPVIVDESGAIMRSDHPHVIIDARMAKSPLDCDITDALLVVGMGPGYEAQRHCHTVIETNRGHHLGRVYWSGMAEPDTGQPGIVKGYTHSRILRASVAGHVRPHYEIGDFIAEGNVIATLITPHQENVPIIAPFDGMLRGLIHPQVSVQTGDKIGDIDPRCEYEHCFTISDKSRAVGGAVLEALFSAPQLIPYLSMCRV